MVKIKTAKKEKKKLKKIFQIWNALPFCGLEKGIVALFHSSFFFFSCGVE